MVEGKILGALHNAMKEIGVIGKNKKNIQQAYMFRGIDDVYNALYPALTDAGIIPAPKFRDLARESHTSRSGSILLHSIITLDLTLYCVEDGSSISVTTSGEGMDSGDKSLNKAMSAAYKYAFLEVFCIPVSDGGLVDSERDSHDLAPRQPQSPQAQPQQQQLPAPSTAEGTFFVDGVPENVITKNGASSKGPWTLLKCDIGGVSNIGTFNKKFQDQIQLALERDLIVKACVETNKKGNFEIKDIQLIETENSLPF